MLENCKLIDNSNSKLLTKAFELEVREIIESTEIDKLYSFNDRIINRIVSNFISDDWIWEQINSTLVDWIYSEVNDFGVSVDVLEEIEARL